MTLSCPASFCKYSFYDPLPPDPCPFTHVTASIPLHKDIASLDASQLSIMPTGFEALPPDDLKSLIEYLAQPH